MRAQIALKGGAVIEVEVTEIETTRGPMTEGMSTIRWVSPEGARQRLHTIDPGQVVAVVLIEDEP